MTESIMTFDNGFHKIVTIFEKDPIYKAYRIINIKIFKWEFRYYKYMGKCSKYELENLFLCKSGYESHKAYDVINFIRKKYNVK